MLEFSAVLLISLNPSIDNPSWLPQLTFPIANNDSLSLLKKELTKKTYYLFFQITKAEVNQNITLRNFYSDFIYFSAIALFEYGRRLLYLCLPFILRFFT